MHVNTNYLDLNDNMKKICFRKTIDGHRTASSNCYFVTVTEAKQIVSVTSLLLQRQKKIVLVTLLSLQRHKNEQVTSLLLLTVNNSFAFITLL
jgi:hypothetical protein